MNVDSNFVGNSQKLEPPKYPSTCEWINKLWYIQTRNTTQCQNT